MKKLLVLTDFSSNAAHAEAVATRLAGKLGANILLYHSTHYTPFIPSDVGGPYVTKTASMLLEDSRERLNKEVAALKHLASETAEIQPDFEYRNTEGSLRDLIVDTNGDAEIEMIVMGGSTGSALDHLLTGSNTSIVINEAIKPVLTIPMNADEEVPRKIVFATNFGTADILAVNYLRNLSSQLDVKLDIVHVNQKADTSKDAGPELAFRNYLSYHGLSYNQVSNAGVHHGLLNYCEVQGADLLAMTHHHRNLMSRWFGHSESREIISDQRIAVLVFPPRFK